MGIVTNLDSVVDSVVSENVSVIAANQAISDSTIKAGEAATSALEAEGYKDLAEIAKSATEAIKVATEGVAAQAVVDLEDVVAQGSVDLQTYVDTGAQHVADSGTNADNAAASVVAAGVQVGLATDQAVLAEASAVEADAQRVLSEEARNQALEYLSATNLKYDQFDDRYLGALWGEPAYDNDGDVIQEGAMFWDMSEKSLKIKPSTTAPWQAVAESSGSLIAASNLGDLLDYEEARGNLNVYAKEETDSKAQLDARDVSNRNVDNHVTGTVNSVYTLVDKSKLNGIEDGATADQNADEVLLSNMLGIPSVGSIEAMNSLVNTSGVVSGCDIINNGNGTVNISTGTVFLRPTADSLDDLYSIEIPASSVLTLVDDSMNYIYADYNGGTPIWVTTTNQNDINCQDKCLAYLLHRNGNVLHTVDDRHHGIDASRKTRAVFKAFSYFIHEDGGSILNEPSPLTIGLTAGSFFYTVTDIPHEAFDTSIAGTDYKNTFELHYRDGLGGWNNIVDTKVIDTTLYDDGTGAVALNNAKYGVSWVYVTHNTPSHLHVVMGQEVYATQADADNAMIPNEVPTVIAGLGSLVGFVTYSKGDTQFSNVLSAFTQSFTSATPTTHNNLAGLQGGGADDYQHLTIDQVAKVDSTTLEGKGIVDAYTIEQINTITDAKFDKTNGDFLLDILKDRQEPTGFVRENPLYMGTIEFCVDGTKVISVDNNGTRTIRTDGTFAVGTAFEQNANALEFVMFPTNNSFYRVYINSIKFDITTLQKTTFSNVAQLQFAYHDENGVLQSDTGFTEEYFLGTPIVSTVYYNPNATAGLRDINFGDERHGTAFTGLEHYITHFTDGTKYIKGMAIDGLAVGQTTFTQITSGEASDEDIIIYPSTQTTAPHMYLNGTIWEKTTDNNVVAYLVGGTTQYNPNGTLTNVNGNDAMIVFFVLTNNIEFPYVKILGQQVYTNTNEARADIENSWSEISLNGLPSPEFLPIGALIVRDEGELQELSDGSLYYDLRKSNLGGAGTSSGTVTSHRDLLDRDFVDSHPANSISVTPQGNLSSVTVQLALEELQADINGLTTIIEW